MISETWEQVVPEAPPKYRHLDPGPNPKTFTPATIKAPILDLYGFQTLYSTF
jgi:hypothetical protein